jgi:cell division protein FtsQ
VTIVDTKPTPEKTDSAADARSKRWIVPAAIAAGAFFLLMAPLWAPLLLRRMAFFQVRHIEVVGARYVEPRDILGRMRVDTLASIWDPTSPIEARVAAHPLVRTVEIDRKLPGTLVVRLVEHAPVALVPSPNGFRVYDDRGVPLPIDPAVVGVDAPILGRLDSVALKLLGAARTDAPELYRRLSEVRREGQHELLLVLDSVPVRALANVTLQRLADLEPVEHDLARRKLRAVELDLRYRDQVIARLQ